MENQRFLFLFNHNTDTYALMWDVINHFLYMVRNSDGKSSDGFRLDGYGNATELKDYKHLVVLKCRSMLNHNGQMLFN